jgi:hypothetical protein
MAAIVGGCQSPNHAVPSIRAFTTAAAGYSPADTMIPFEHSRLLKTICSREVEVFK